MIPNLTIREAFIVAFVCTCGVLFAQSNDLVDELLAQDTAHVGHTAYLVYTASGVIDPSVDVSDAVATAIDSGTLPVGTAADAPVDFGAFSYMLMDAFDIPGGIMYRIVPGRRYAAREVVYQEWSRTRRAPGELLDGDSVVRILSVFLNEQGGAE